VLVVLDLAQQDDLMEQGLARELVNRWVLYDVLYDMYFSVHNMVEVLVVLDLPQQDDLVEQSLARELVKRWVSK
jgi:hypothetical protein